MITIVGLGFGEKYAITLEAINAIKNADEVILRTEHHPSVEILREEGVEFSTLDYLYEEIEDFEELYSSIANHVLEKSAGKNLCYVVPGSPSIAESTVNQLRQMTDDIIYVEAVSFIEPSFNLAGIDPVEGALFLDAMDVDIDTINPNLNIMITQVWNEFLMSDLKLKLMEIYEDDKIIYALTDAGIKGVEKCQKVQLYELDREVKPDIRLTLVIPKAEVGFMEIVKRMMNGEEISSTGYDVLDADRQRLLEAIKTIGENIEAGYYEFKELYNEL